MSKITVELKWIVLSPSYRNFSNHQLRFHIQLSLHLLLTSLSTTTFSLRCRICKKYYILTECTCIIQPSDWLSGVSNKLLSLIHCSILLLLCHRGCELHCEILRTCDHGWSSLLQMQTLHIDLPHSCPRVQIQDCSEGQSETVSCSNWDLIKISAQLSGMSKAETFASWTKPIKTKRKSLYCHRLLKKTSFVFSQTFTETQICCFHLITSFHLSFILHFAVTQRTSSWHCSATLKGVQREAVRWDEGAASHVAALILHEAHGAHAHTHILYAGKELNFSTSAFSLTNRWCGCKVWSWQSHTENNIYKMHRSVMKIWNGILML